MVYGLIWVWDLGTFIFFKAFPPRNSLIGTLCGVRPFPYLCYLARYDLYPQIRVRQGEGIRVSGWTTSRIRAKPYALFLQRPAPFYLLKSGTPRWLAIAVKWAAGQETAVWWPTLFSQSPMLAWVRTPSCLGPFWDRLWPKQTYWEIWSVNLRF